MPSALTHIALTCRDCGTRWSTSVDEWIPYGDPMYVCCPKCPVLVRIDIPFPGQDRDVMQTVVDGRQFGGVR